MESLDEEIRRAMEVEIRRLTEEEEVEKKKLMERKEIRDIRFKSVLNISPLEIIDNVKEEEEEDGYYLNIVENINQIELVIDAIHHYYIYQYWSPPSTTTTTTTTANSLCQHHDYHHPRDDDDEDMILTSCSPLCDPRIIKFSIDQGVFASDHTDDHIMSTLLRDVGILLEHDFLYTPEQLEDVKRSITCRISEAKAHILRARPLPKKVRICVDISQVAKKYYRSAEVATFVAAMDAAIMASMNSTINIGDDAYNIVSYTNIYNTKRASKLSKKTLRVKTLEKEDLLLFMGSNNNNNNSSYSCPVCWNEFSIGVDIVLIMPCSHMFHCECLHNWLRERNSCPLCRFELNTWDPWNNQKR